MALHLNIGTNGEPLFAEAIWLQVGPGGEQIDIDVGERAAPCFADWNGDGRRDLVVGGIDGRFHLFINEGTDHEPFFPSAAVIQDEAGDIIMPGELANPDVFDFDGDGLVDLISGNVGGDLFFFRNLGPEDDPLLVFAGYLSSGGEPIGEYGLARTRPFVCDWTGDGHPDLLIGATSGRVWLGEGYEGMVGVEEAPGPAHARLLPPWPNPFNPHCTLAYELERPAGIRLSIHDIQGRLLRTLDRGFRSAGRYEVKWRGNDEDGREMPSGLYFTRLKYDNGVELRKLLLLR